jgi:hypothetical protein
MGSRNPNW